MKWIKRIFAWIIVSLVIQFSGLFYANNFLLASDVKLNSVKVNKKNKEKDENKKVNISEDAKDIHISPNGKYVAYYENGLLKVINTLDNKEHNIETNDNNKIEFYKWVPDKNRNRLLIGEREQKQGKHGFKLAYYDVDKEIKNDINHLTWANEESKIEDIQASILTNLIYIKVSRGYGENSIYKIDIMNNLNKVNVYCGEMGEIGVLRRDDNLIYEDLSKGTVHVTNSPKKFKMKAIDNLKFLGIDYEDNIYLAESENNKITKVIYGSLEQDIEEWRTLKLETPANRKDIFISEQGKIYINDNLKGEVSDLGSNKKYKYKGKFITMYDNGIVSKGDGVLYKKVLN